MIEKYQRKEGENEYEYGLRLIETKIEQKPDDLEWEDIIEATGLDVHRDSLRKAASVTPYSGYSVMQYFKKKYANASEAGSTSYAAEIDAKIAELRKETQKYFDQRREFNKLLIQIGRKENLEDKLVDAAQHLDETIGRVPFSCEVTESGDKEAVLVLCDWHFGMVTNNIWNTYNTDICKERVMYTMERTAEKLLLHKCNRLHIVVLGDMIHGATHVTARVASEELVCEQIMGVAELLAQAVEFISQYVSYVDVYTTYGNHARTIQNKKESIHADNMERIIPWWLKERLKDSETIEIHSDFDDEIMYMDVCGCGIASNHGDIDTVKTAPKLMQVLMQKRYGRNVDYILLADKHHRESFEELGVTAIICGSLCGTDEYATNKRLYSTPEQLLMIFSEKDRLDAEYHIRLT